MSVFKRGNTYWYKFWFAGRLVRESAKTHSKTLAKSAEKERRKQLESGYNNLTDGDRAARVKTLKEAAADYSTAYAARHTAKSVKYSELCIRHLVQHLGDKMLIEISDKSVEVYQSKRLGEGAAGKTINEEIGELLRIMGDVGDVVRLKLKKAKKLRLKTREDCGRALTADEEARLLECARKAISPAIYPAVVLSLNTTMRDSEMRHLTWGQVDFLKRMITVGKSKTAEGTGRTIPMNAQLFSALTSHKSWYESKVDSALPANYVLPGGKSRHYNSKRPMTTLKTAWQNVKDKAEVDIRLHDLRHTAITKLAESGAGDETIMAIAGHVSRRMLSRYAHIRMEAKRRAVEAISNVSLSTSMAEQVADFPKEATAIH